MNEREYVLGQSALTVADVVWAARAPLHVGMTAQAQARMAAARAVVDDHLRDEVPVYGLNTGLGANVGYRLAAEAIPAFQQQLVRGRVVGVGDPLRPETCRAVLFCRTAALATGGAGVSPHVHALMREMLERDVTPVIPSHGSIGAGDLGLLASIAAVMIGRGTAFHAGRLMPGGDALAEAGLQPVALGAKDGLAVANASAVTSAMASLALDAARKLLSVHIATAAFHTPAIALAFDAIAISMTYIATASAYRSIKLMTGRLSGLPNYLTPAGGASAGFVPLQKTISALHAEIRLKAYPASIDGIPVSDAVEDLTPQTPLTIRKFSDQLALLRWLISIEALVAAQAWDLRGAPDKGGQPGAAGRQLYDTVRSAVAFMGEDRETGPDVTAVHSALWSEQTVAVAEAVLGPVPPRAATGHTAPHDTTLSKSPRKP